MLTVVLARCIFTALPLGIWLRLYAPRHLQVGRKDLAVLFLISPLAPVASSLGFMLSVVYLPVATALVVHYTTPMVTAMGSSLMTGERPSVYDLCGALVVALGVACSVMRPNWVFDSALSVPGLLWGLAGILGLAFQTLWGRASVIKGGPTGIGILFYTHLFGSLWMLPIKTLSTGWGDIPQMTGSQVFLIAVIVLFASLAGYSTFYAALRYIPAPTVSLLTSGEVPAAVITTSALTHSWPTLPAIVGCVLILSAIALSSWGARRRAMAKAGDLGKEGRPWL